MAKHPKSKQTRGIYRLDGSSCTHHIFVLRKMGETKQQQTRPSRNENRKPCKEGRDKGNEYTSTDMALHFCTLMYQLTNLANVKVFLPAIDDSGDILLGSLTNFNY